MKAILTLFLVLFLGFSALAQNQKTYDKVDTHKMDIVLGIGHSSADTNFQGTRTVEKKVVRLYKFKNTRIKKALAFTTKRNKAKMA